MILLNIITTILAEIILLFCGSFFASSETAFTSLSRVTVRQMLKDNEPNAKKVAKLRDNLDTLISTVLIGTNFITTLISSLATAFTVKYIGASYVSYATVIVSVLVIMFSEIIPKTYAGDRPKEVARSSAPAIIVLQKIFFPIIWFFECFSRLVNTIEHSLIKKKQPLITEDELKTLLAVGENEGTLETDERRMLERIFEFSDLLVHDIMRHRSLIRYVNVNDSVNDVIHAFALSGYSRLPVYEDTVDNIIGVIHYKSVLFAGTQISQSSSFVRICMHEPMFVPESLSVIELLRKFKKERTNFAVAINEYGSMAGIVTMDDILKEVFGRMTDEYGAVEVSPERRISVIGTNEFVVPGDMKIDDVNEVLNLNLYSEDFDTVGGWLLEKFGELPAVGAIYNEGTLIFIVEDQSARRIQSVRIKLVDADAASARAT